MVELRGVVAKQGPLNLLNVFPLRLQRFHRSVENGLILLLHSICTRAGDDNNSVSVLDQIVICCKRQSFHALATCTDLGPGQPGFGHEVALVSDFVKLVVFGVPCDQLGDHCTDLDGSFYKIDEDVRAHTQIRIGEDNDEIDSHQLRSEPAVRCDE